jgi:hypothetical protein
MGIECSRWDWQALFASEHGPDPTTRHVLHVVAMHLFGEQKSAFPGQERIAVFTGLTSRAVRAHLALAEKGQWLKIKPNKRRGKNGYWNTYLPTIPRRLARHLTNSRPEPGSTREDLRPEPCSTRNPRPEPGSRRPENDDTTTGNSRRHDRNDVPPNQVLNHVSNKALNSERDSDVVNDFWKNRTGIEWQEGRALATAIGFRDPQPTEIASAYMAAAVAERDRLPPPEICRQIGQRPRRKVVVNGKGELHTVIVGDKPQ